MGYITDLKLPRLGETMETGRVTLWCIAPGESYQRGERLLELETDKTIVEVPALQEGRLIEILADVDTVVSVGDSIARVELDGEAPQSEKSDRREVTASADVSMDRGSQSGVVPETTLAQDFHNAANTGAEVGGETASTDKRFVTPRARYAANQYRLNLEDVTGTGRRGRIVYNDVMDAVKRIPLFSDVETMRVSTRWSTGFSTTTELVDTAHGQLHYTRWFPDTAQCDVVVVMIHGVFSDGQMWSDSAANLARSGFNVCAVDLPGHGNTQSPVTRPGDIATAVAVSLQKQAGNICLVGHSFGALVATHVATLLGSRVHALKLIAPVGLGTAINQSFLDGMSRPASIDDVRDQLSKLNGAGKVPDTAFIKALWLRLQKDSNQLGEICNQIAKGGIQQSDIRQELTRLSCDISIMWGRDDRILNWEDALNAPVQSSLHIVSGAGHMPLPERQSLLLELVMHCSTSFRVL